MLDISSLMASAYIASSSADQLAFGMAGHSIEYGVFMTAGGVAIVYMPQPIAKTFNGIDATVGWSGAEIVKNRIGI